MSLGTKIIAAITESNLVSAPEKELVNWAANADEVLEAIIEDIHPTIRKARNDEESLSAKRKYVALCNHSPELVIGSENGLICCECWAMAEAKRADEADREHQVTLVNFGEKFIKMQEEEKALRREIDELKALLR